MRSNWLVLFVICCFASGALAEEIVVSIPDQKLALIERSKVMAEYRVSTSKFGIGDTTGSYRTPLGVLFVSGKFGDHLASGTKIENRAPTREIISVDAPGRDAIVSRVIWLRGMETQNAGAHERCIYIHGTPEERRIGKPASFGCVRMRSRDIIALYDRVHIGAHVTISTKALAELVPAEEPTFAIRD